jgi:tRNA(Ile2) C34 agmatinyltransferase TiaS
MKRASKKQTREGCSEVLEEEKENALLDYEDEAEVTADGKYRCRDCGMLFDTLEEHNVHHLTVHGQMEVPNPGMTM